MEEILQYSALMTWACICMHGAKKEAIAAMMISSVMMRGANALERRIIGDGFPVVQEMFRDERNTRVLIHYAMTALQKGFYIDAAFGILKRATNQIADSSDPLSYCQEVLQYMQLRQRPSLLQRKAIWMKICLASFAR